MVINTPVDNANSDPPSRQPTQALEIVAKDGCDTLRRHMGGGVHCVQSGWLRNKLEASFIFELAFLTPILLQNSRTREHGRGRSNHPFASKLP